MHCLKSSPIFCDISLNVVENSILQGNFRVVSRFPRYISCYSISRKVDFLWAVCKQLSRGLWWHCASVVQDYADTIMNMLTQAMIGLTVMRKKNWQKINWCILDNFYLKAIHLKKELLGSNGQDWQDYLSFAIKYLSLLADVSRWLTWCHV